MDSLRIQLDTLEARNWTCRSGDIMLSAVERDLPLSRRRVRAL
jgi:hypothetical protein